MTFQFASHEERMRAKFFLFSREHFFVAKDKAAVEGFHGNIWKALRIYAFWCFMLSVDVARRLEFSICESLSKLEDDESEI